MAVVEVVVTHTREEPPEDARPRRGGVCLVKLRVKVGARVRARARARARASMRLRMRVSAAVRTSTSMQVTITLCSQRARVSLGAPQGVCRCTRMLVSTCRGDN